MFDQYVVNYAALPPGNEKSSKLLSVGDGGLIVYELSTPPHFNESCDVVFVKGTFLVTMSIRWTEGYEMNESFPEQLAMIQADKLP